jgi:hypothetical protein
MSDGKGGEGKAKGESDESKIMIGKAKHTENE